MFQEMKRDFPFSIRMGLWRAAQFLLCVVIILGFASPSSAQMDRAALTGTVMDSSGRVLPETHVLAVQNDTGLRRETTSSDRGTYDIPELPIGVYTVTFTHDGFETLRFENVVQSLGRTRTLNATLKVAGAKEESEVRASPPSLDQTLPHAP